MKENDPFNIDSFWPEASSMLDQHFARKRAIRRLRIFGLGGFALLLSVLAFIFWSKDLLNPSAQKKENNLSKSETEKLVNIERSAAAIKISSQTSSSETSGIPTQNNMSDKPSKELQQSSDSENGDGNNRNVQITGNRDKSTYQSVNAAFTSVQEKNDDKAFSDSEKSTAGNFDGSVLADADVLKNDYAEIKTNAAKNENTTNSSVVELARAEPIAQNETPPLSASSDSENDSIAENASNTPSGGIVPELGEVNKSSWEWALVPSAGIFNTAKQFNSSTDESAYVSRRTLEEENTFRESFRMGLEVSKGRLTVQSGIYFSVYGERTAYRNWLIRTIPEIAFYNQVIYDTSLSLVSYLDMGNFYEISVATVDSSVQTFADTTMVTVESAVDAVQFRVQNRISYFELPLGLRYTLYRSSLVDVGISAGGSLGFLWRSRGYVVNSGLDEFVQLDAAAGLQKIIGNARIAADVRVKLSENLYLGMRPEWNTTIGSVLRQNTIQQNYRNWGMLLELKKTF